jgi:hypothetical protein
VWKNAPWGTKHQPRDSIDKLETNRAEATALYSGNIDSKQPNSTGNLINFLKKTHKIWIEFRL